MTFALLKVQPAVDRKTVVVLRENSDERTKRNNETKNPKWILLPELTKVRHLKLKLEEEKINKMTT